MKKLLRRWLSIDEILEDRKVMLCRYEEVLQRLLQIEGKVGFYKDLPSILENVEFNAKRLNDMMLELKGVVCMARAMVSEGRIKPK